MPALAGQGWRVDFGVAVLVLQSITILVSLYIIQTRSHIPPLSTRSNLLSRLIVLTAIPMFYVPLVEIMGEAWLPCRAYFWIAGPITAVLGGAISLQFFRLVRMYGYESLKKKYKYGKVRLTDKQVAELRQYQKWHSEKFLLLANLVNLVIICLLTCLPMFLTDDYYNTANTGCHLQQPPWYKYVKNQSYRKLDSLYMVWFAQMVLFTPSMMWLGKQLHEIKRNSNGDTKLLREMLASSVIMMGSAFACLGVIWADYGHYMTMFNYNYIDAWVPTVYSIGWIIIPSLRNTDRMRKLKQWHRYHFDGDESENDDRTEMLNLLHTALGWAYMNAQCKSEFNEETLQCLKAIWLYKEKPSYPKMMQLHNQFIEEYSPFQVNISASNRYRLSKLVLSIQPECSVIEIEKIYDGVENELITLLTNNSYARFQKSDRYKQYQAGQPCAGDTDESNTASQHTASANTATLDKQPSSKRLQANQLTISVDASNTQPTRVTRRNSATNLSHTQPRASHELELEAEIDRLVEPGLNKPRTSVHAPSSTNTMDIDDDINALMYPGNRPSLSTQPAGRHTRNSSVPSLPGTVNEDHTGVSTVAPQRSRHKNKMSTEFDKRQGYVGPRLKLSIHKPVDTGNTDYRVNVNG